MKTNSEDGKREVLLPVLVRGTLGVAGFILSPLSWWNDVIVNFRLAYGFAL